MKLEFSAGGVIFKKVDRKIYWLITRSSPSKQYLQTIWRLPKGWIDDENDKPGPSARGEKKADEEKLKEAALREVKEEGGIDAKIIKKVGTYRFFLNKSGEKLLKFVTFYLMEWKNDLPEGFGYETSETGWFSLNKAIEKLKHKSEKEVLVKANKILNSDT